MTKQYIIQPAWQYPPNCTNTTLQAYHAGRLASKCDHWGFGVVGAFKLVFVVMYDLWFVLFYNNLVLIELIAPHSCFSQKWNYSLKEIMKICKRFSKNMIQLFLHVNWIKFCNLVNILAWKMVFVSKQVRILREFLLIIQLCPNMHICRTTRTFHLTMFWYLTIFSITYQLFTKNILCQKCHLILWG